VKKSLLLILITLICHLTLVISHFDAAFAANPVYTLGGFIVSSGGRLDLGGGGYKLQDIKGQPLAGSMSGGGYTLGLGGEYVFFQPNEVVLLGAPSGTVPVEISRSDDGTGIIVSWANSGYQGSPSVYILTGDGSGTFVNGGPRWLLAVNGESGVSINEVDKTLIHGSQAGGRGDAEVYYKVLQAGVLRDSPNATVLGKTNLEAAPAVGKLNITITKGWNQIAVPFATSAIVDSLGIKYANGDQLWAWRNGAFIAPITFNSATNNWGNGFALTMAEGYGLKVMDDGPGAIKTIVGKLFYEDVNKEIIKGWNLIGLPYPLKIANNFNLTVDVGAINGDQLWEWKNGAFISPRTFNGVDWPQGNIEIGKGYGYKSLGQSINWRLIKNDIYR